MLQVCLNAAGKGTSQNFEVPDLSCFAKNFRESELFLVMSFHATSLTPPNLLPFPENGP